MNDRAILDALDALRREVRQLKLDSASSKVPPSSSGRLLASTVLDAALHEQKNGKRGEKKNKEDTGKKTTRASKHDFMRHVASTLGLSDPFFCGQDVDGSGDSSGDSDGESEGSTLASESAAFRHVDGCFQWVSSDSERPIVSQRGLKIRPQLWTYKHWDARYRSQASSRIASVAPLLKKSQKLAYSAAEVEQSDVLQVVLNTQNYLEDLNRCQLLKSWQPLNKSSQLISADVMGVEKAKRDLQIHALLSAGGGGSRGGGGGGGRGRGRGGGGGGRGGGRGGDKFKGTCFSCGEVGHRKDQCPKEKSKEISNT